MFLKRIRLILIVALVTFSMAACATDNNDSANDVVATVNGVDIGIDVFEDIVKQLSSQYAQQGLDIEGEGGEAILQQIEQEAINSLVQQEVILQEAKNKGFDVSDEEVVEELENIKQQYPAEEDFETALQENDLTENKLKAMITDQMQVMNYINSLQSEVKVTVSEDEVKEIYEQYKTQMEAQMEGSENIQEMPAFEDIKDMLENELKQRKEQEQVGQMIEKLVEESEIEIYL